jgi:hypothetical protein
MSNFNELMVSENLRVLVSSDEEQWVAIKPICKLLGVNYSSQSEKIKKHPILNPLTMLRGSKGVDGRNVDMLCLPRSFAIFWIGGINPENVKEESKPLLIDMQLKICQALDDYFSGNTARRRVIFSEKSKLEQERKQLLADLQNDERFKRIGEIDRIKKSNQKELQRIDESLKAQFNLFAEIEE